MEVYLYLSAASHKPLYHISTLCLILYDISYTVVLRLPLPYHKKPLTALQSQDILSLAHATDIFAHQIAVPESVQVISSLPNPLPIHLRTWQADIPHTDLSYHLSAPSEFAIAQRSCYQAVFYNIPENLHGAVTYFFVPL